MAYVSTGGIDAYGALYAVGTMGRDQHTDGAVTTLRLFNLI